MTTHSFSTEIIAHRGASFQAPENTIASIQLAESYQADYIEIDVQESKDEQIVVIHDKSLDRTTNGSGEVKKLNYSQIKSYDAGSWFSTKFSNQKVPLLEDVLKLKLKSKLIIEVKSTSKTIVNNIFELVSKYNMQEGIIIKSFYPKVIRDFKLLSPKTLSIYVFLAALGPITIDNFLRWRKPTEVEADYYQLHRLFAFKSTLLKIKAQQKKVILWGYQDYTDFNSSDFPTQIDLIEVDNLALYKIKTH